MRTLALLVVVLLAFPSASSASSAALAQSHIGGDWTADTRNTWHDADGEPRIQIALRSSAGDNRWGFGIRLRDLAGLPPAAVLSVADAVQFSFTREAGVFRFSGSFNQGRGAGTYTFTADPAFATTMAAAGYRNLSTDEIVRLAVIDVTTAFARGIAQAGYPSLSLDDLVRFRIHRVSPEMVRDLGALGYRQIPADDLVRMAIHGATPASVKALQDAGIRGPRWRKPR